MDFSSASFPKPKDWQAFERCCQILFKCDFDDPNTQRNGRSGQPQHGVDIYGRRGGSGPLVGVQCKGKEESTYGNKVTETELRDEVKKAFLFIPRLSEFILATTAPNDVTIQEVARLITEENEKVGNPMIVNVYGWEELYSRIIQYPDALRAFHPDSGPFTQEIQSDIEEIKTRVVSGNAALHAEMSQMKTEILIALSANTSGSSSKEQSDLEAHLHKQIDSYRDLIKVEPQTAKLLLEKLKEEIWKKASSRIKFRITTNIGAALLRSGEDKSAADIFLSAIEYDPLDKIGMANVALAYLIKGNSMQAIKAANDAVKQNPDNDDAACYLMQAHYTDQNVTNPFSLIPENLWKKKGAIIGAIYIYRKRGMGEWRNIALEAIKTFPEDRELKRAAAEANLDIVCQSKEVILGQVVSSEQDLKNLNDSIPVLQSIWDNVKTSENKFDASLPHNLAVAYRIFNKYEEGIKVIDEALLKVPDDIMLIKLKAVLHLALGQEDKALLLLDEKRGSDPDAAILTAELLLRKDLEKARNLLTDITKFELSEEQKILISLLQIDIYLRDDNNGKALEVAEKTAKDYPKNIQVIIVLSDILRKRDDGSAKKILLQAKDLINAESSFLDRFLLAQKLHDWQQYDEAEEILDGHIDFQRDSPALQLFLAILNENNRRKKAHDCIKQLPTSLAEKPFYLRMKAGIHITRGDYLSAEKALDKYLQLCPEDISLRHTWVSICFRRPEGEAKIKAFLEGDIEKLKGPAQDRMQFAILLDKFGFEERALQLGYRIFLENHENPEIHVKYMALLLRPDKVGAIDLNVKEIGPDTVFIFENDRQEKDYFIVEKDASLRLDRNAVSPDHPIVKKAIGLHIGESFTIDNAIGVPEKYKVKSIKHKYLDSLHKCMEHFNHQFPSFQGFQRLVVDPQSPEKALTPVKARHDAFQNLFAQYDKMPIPISVFADRLGINVIAAWQGIIETRRKFMVCLGTAEERNIALKAIENNSGVGCVTDALTFYIIRRLGLEDAVVKICGKIGVTESSVDIFRTRLEEIELHGGKPFLVVAYQNGQYVKEDITIEKLQAAHTEVKNDLKWIEENCDILAAESDLESVSVFRDIFKKFGKNFFDSVLAADGAKRILLCEDYPYRLVATHNIDLKTTWLQPVLMMARDKNILSPDKFDDVICYMLDRGFQFISVNAETLLRVSNLTTDMDSKKFNKIAEALGGPSADMPSHIRVATDFFNAIWKEYDPPLNRKAQTGKILECLTEGRRKEITAIIKYIYMLNKSSKTFSEYVLDWLKGHFYLPFETK